MSKITLTGIMILIGMITIILKNMGLIMIDESLYRILMIIVVISSFIWSFVYAYFDKSNSNSQIKRKNNYED